MKVHHSVPTWNIFQQTVFIFQTRLQKETNTIAFLYRIFLFLSPFKLLTSMKTAQNNFTTTSMQQRHSWQGNSSADSQDFPCILWLLKVHYHAHKNMQIIPILSHINPLQCPPILFPKDQFLYYLPINANVLQMLSFLKVSPPKPCMQFPSTPHMPHIFNGTSSHTTVKDCILWCCSMWDSTREWIVPS